jgi:hypothetical protein
MEGLELSKISLSSLGIFKLRDEIGADIGSYSLNHIVSLKIVGFLNM